MLGLERYHGQKYNSLEDVECSLHCILDCVTRSQTASGEGLSMSPLKRLHSGNSCAGSPSRPPRGPVGGGRPPRGLGGRGGCPPDGFPYEQFK